MVPMKVHLVIATSALTACVHTAPTPATSAYWVTSDSSLYTPVTRFRARVDVHPERLVVIVDSTTVAVPGEAIPGAPPLMSDLYLSAIVAVADSTSRSVVSRIEGNSRHSMADRRGWTPLAASDSVLLVPELRYGETASLPTIALTIPGAFTNDPRTLWLIFRIDGNTVELSAPLHAGGAVQRRDLPGGVRVYACGDRDLLGQLDPMRARALKHAYGIGC
jgi:hypothetical protein